MQDVVRVAQELSKGDNLVQTPRATPAGPANMVGVRFLLQLPAAESPKSPPVLLLLFHCFAPPLAPSPYHAPKLPPIPTLGSPSAPPLQNTWLDIDPGCCILRHMRCCGIASGHLCVLTWIQAHSCHQQC